MLPSKNRLPAYEVASVMRVGKRLATDTLQLSWKSNDAHVFRCAVAVGVKVSKKAVERNRVKRLIREGVQHMLPQLSSVDGVLVARKELVGKSQEDVEQLVRELLVRAAVM